MSSEFDPRVAELEKRVNTLSESRVSVLERQVAALRRQVRLHEEWVDTVSSSLLKRLWFVIKGYRFRRLGVWYRASWNSESWEQEPWPPSSS